MSVSVDIIAKIKKYMEQLKREEKVKHALSRLDRIDMTIDLLKETGVGKSVRQLCEHKLHGSDASRVLEKWMEMARKSGIAPPEKPSTSSGGQIGSGESCADRRQSRKRAASPAHQPRKSSKMDSTEKSKYDGYFPPLPPFSPLPTERKEMHQTTGKSKYDGFFPPLPPSSPLPAKHKENVDPEIKAKCDVGGKRKKMVAIALPTASREEMKQEEVFDKCKEAESTSQPPMSGPNPVRSSTGATKKQNRKKSALMAKALKMYNNKRSHFSK